MALSDGIIDIAYTGTDAENDACTLVVEFSITGFFTGEEAVATPIATDGAHDGISAVAFTSGGATLNFVWDALIDLGAGFIGTVFIRMTPNDGFVDGITVITSNNIALFTLPDLKECIAQNVSADRVGIRISRSLNGEYYRTDLESLDVASPPQWAVDHPSFQRLISNGTIKVIREALGDAEVVTNRELRKYVAFGFVDLNDATFADTNVIANSTVHLMAINASAAALTDVHVTSVTEGNFTAIASGVGASDLFSFIAIAKEV